MKNRTATRALLATTALAAVFAIARPAYAGDITVPAVPDKIAVPAGNEVFLVGHATGTQNYVCLPSGTGVAFTLFTPEATLFNDDGKQIITHFFSPNPFESNTNPALAAVGPIRATWQYRDTSSVWAEAKPGNAATFATDPKFVAQGAVAWLLLTAVGGEDGPDGGDVLTATTFVQRLSTSGGVAPSTGCSSSADVGHLAFVPYRADYFFYRAHRDN